MPARIVKIELGGDVDHGRLDEDADHPPVTGGNSATSRAPDSGASGPIIAPSIAARMRSGSAKADAPRSSRAPSHASNAATSATSPGSSTTSPATPIRSRTQAQSAISSAINPYASGRRADRKSGV